MQDQQRLGVPVGQPGIADRGVPEHDDVGLAGVRQRTAAEVRIKPELNSRIQALLELPLPRRRAAMNDDALFAVDEQRGRHARQRRTHRGRRASLAALGPDHHRNDPRRAVLSRPDEQHALVQQRLKHLRIGDMQRLQQLLQAVRLSPCAQRMGDLVVA